MGHVRSKTRSPGQILENSFLNNTSDLDSPVSPVVYKAMKKRELLKIFTLRWAFQGPLGPLVYFDKFSSALLKFGLCNLQVVICKSVFLNPTIEQIKICLIWALFLFCRRCFFLKVIQRVLVKTTSPTKSGIQCRYSGHEILILFRSIKYLVRYP